MKKPFFVNTHIEKCAGTSLNFILGNNFNFMVYPTPIGFTNDIETTFNENHISKLMKRFPFIEGVGGHNIRPFTPFEDVVKDRKIFRFTMLREPLSRYFSFLNYNRTKMGFDLSIEEFIETERFSNFMCNKICGSPSAEEAISLAEEKINLIGITEYFSPSINLLSHLYPKKWNKAVVKRNVLEKEHANSGLGPVKWADFTDAQKKKAEENNAEDIILYNHFFEKFRMQYLTTTGNELRKLPVQSNSVFPLKFYNSIVVKRLYRKVIERRMFHDYLHSGTHGFQFKP